MPAGDSFEPARGAVLAIAFDLGEVRELAVTRYAVLAYDDVYSIEYLMRRLRPCWRRNGATAEDLLRSAFRDYPSLSERSRKFDEELTRDLQRRG